MTADRLQRGTLRRDGLDLAVHDALTGLAFVFQHGLCGSVAQTAEACPETLDDGRAVRLLTLECRGHGASPLGEPTQLSIATLADDVAALIEQTGVGPVDLGGISMGAAIALRLAVRRPELVRSLVLVRPAWVTEPAPDNGRPNLEVGDWLSRMQPERALAAFEASATARRLAQVAPDNLASLRGFFAREPIAETVELLSRIPADGPGVSDEQVRAIRVPVTVIGHEADAIHPMAHARALAALMPHARLVTITPKAVDKAAYLHDLHAALRQHLRSPV
ncbi:alpha/beta fold hydrolase [Sphaerotilus mobilis]|uniref:Pimeloyl-ACP methyl ester carboxylesterase n=1 Tax=Sphaerotilus mobilis TaxID=47994 RepID=A0A4Q7LFX6_9BURK|nr:alpha/beta hydrolase [Sphaerotilus mobilis]RZS52921.1 pimeloyl-ACP methyl ester carboxylesterase [Sphaerotilus mobilis]